jgi:uncharacterized protein with HEPN domain
MSILNDQQRLKHALNAAVFIQDAVKERGLKTIIDDPLLMAGVERHLEIIGEAINRLSAAYKNEHPEIEWKKIVRFRNFLIHEYFSVDIAIVLNIIEEKLPQLIIAITPLVNND